MIHLLALLIALPAFADFYVGSVELDAQPSLDRGTAFYPSVSIPGQILRGYLVSEIPSPFTDTRVKGWALKFYLDGKLVHQVAYMDSAVFSLVNGKLELSETWAREINGGLPWLRERQVRVLMSPMGHIAIPDRIPTRRWGQVHTSMFLSVQDSRHLLRKGNIPLFEHCMNLLRPRP